MQGILNLLNDIGEFLNLAWEFFSSLLQGLGDAISMILSCIPLTTSLAGFVPAIIAGSMITTVTIFVVKFTVGR